MLRVEQLRQRLAVVHASKQRLHDLLHLGGQLHGIQRNKVDELRVGDHEIAVRVNAAHVVTGSSSQATTLRSV